MGELRGFEGEPGCSEIDKMGEHTLTEIQSWGENLEI